MTISLKNTIPLFVLRLSEFDFHLPNDLIAKFPVTPRDHSRLMVVERNSGKSQGVLFYDLSQFLKKGDLLVVNTTKVLPVRLFATVLLTTRELVIEIFLLEKKGELIWKCLVKPAKKIKKKVPLTVLFPEGVKAQLYFESAQREQKEGFFIRFSPEFFLKGDEDFFSWLSIVGEIPLPPYLKRKSTVQDKSSYQTVYAKEAGSVAAPTAGLHFTENLLGELEKKGIKIAELCLHVGLGTFAPIDEEQLRKKERLHEERFFIPENTQKEIEKAKSENRRVIAVGTTSLRALESWSLLKQEDTQKQQVHQQEQVRSTSLFIQPGFSFTIADGLVTNFHLPQSSLLLLVCAFLGKEKTLACYDTAIKQKYRFYSYGDAMLIL